LPEDTPFHCPKFSCRKKFTSDSLRHTHIKLHHADHLQVAKNVTVRKEPRHREPAQRCEINVNKDSVKDLDVFSYIGNSAKFAASDAQPQSAALPRTETCP
jgi:hypothetical protein